MLRNFPDVSECIALQNNDYAKTFELKGTTVHIVAPKIGEEEKIRRLDEINTVIRALWNKRNVSNVNFSKHNENSDIVQ